MYLIIPIGYTITVIVTLKVLYHFGSVFLTWCLNRVMKIVKAKLKMGLAKPSLIWDATGHMGGQNKKCLALSIVNSVMLPMLDLKLVFPQQN